MSFCCLSFSLTQMLIKQALKRSVGIESYGMRPHAIRVLMGVSATIELMNVLNDSLQPSLEVMFSARSKPTLMFPKLEEQNYHC